MAYGQNKKSNASILKIVGLLVLLIVLVIGGLLWFDYLGLVEAKGGMSFFLKLLGVDPQTEIVDDGDEFLLDKQRLSKQQESVDIRMSELDLREDQLELSLAELTEKEEKHNEEKTAMEEQKKSLNDVLKTYENEERNLRQSAGWLMGMEPKKAVEQLVTMDEYNAVNLLRMSEQMAQENGTASMVAYWLSLMPKEKSSSLQEKLIGNSGGDETFMEEP